MCATALSCFCNDWCFRSKPYPAQQHREWGQALSQLREGLVSQLSDFLVSWLWLERREREEKELISPWEVASILVYRGFFFLLATLIRISKRWNLGVILIKGVSGEFSTLKKWKVAFDSLNIRAGWSLLAWWGDDEQLPQPGGWEWAGGQPPVRHAQFYLIKLVPQPHPWQLTLPLYIALSMQLPMPPENHSCSAAKTSDFSDLSLSW